ncbi:MAG: hypothetical protein ACLFN8_00655 [Candidatus Woesearchaeota archaeon]
MNQFDDNPFQKLQDKNLNITRNNAPQGTSGQEELIEAIIEEKWEMLLKDLTKLAEWKNNTTQKVITMEQQMQDMRREFDKVHSLIISKIDDYDKNMTNVGAEVRAMEKVFTKVLPLFTENVAELSKITKELKKQPTENFKTKQ